MTYLGSKVSQTAFVTIERMLVHYFEQLGCPAELSRDGSNEWLLDTLSLQETEDDLSLTAIAAAIASALPSPNCGGK